MSNERLYPAGPGTTRWARPRIGLARSKWLTAICCIAAVALSQASLEAAVYEIQNDGDMAVVNGAVFFPFNSGDAAGSGLFNPFLRVQGNGGSQSGYNTGGTDQFDTKDSEGLLLASIPQTTINGVAYYEIALDLNEADAPISLNALHLLTSLSGELTGYNPASYSFSSGSAVLAYDLDEGEDNRVDMIYRDNPGSGRSDYLILVPASIFSYVAGSGSTYVYLYCEMGTPGFKSDNGYEEWATFDNGPVFKPGVKIEKYVNGMDADSAPGPFIEVGEQVTWTYYVTNDGTYDLTDVVVTDSEEGKAGFISGDITGNDILEAGETWVYEVTGAAIEGHYFNIGTVNALAAGLLVTDSDEAHYTGYAPPSGNASISIKKKINGEDADTTPGPYINVGGSVHWTFEVTNTGDKNLSNVKVTDDALGVTYEIPGTFLKGTTVTLDKWGQAVAGQHENIATVIGESGSTTVMASDSAHYFGAQPALKIEKLTNGQDGPEIPVGDPVTWTYTVINTGNVPLQDIVVTDNKFSSHPGYVQGDDGDSILDPGEAWVFEASGTAGPGDYYNTGTAKAYWGTKELSAQDTSSYKGVSTSISIVKRTNGKDANDPSQAPFIVIGDPVTWIYEITNTGDLPLVNVVVSDDQGVAPVLVTSGNNDDVLESGEIWKYEAKGVAEAGLYKNIGTVTAETELGAKVSASDPSHYYGVVASIDIEKSTNGKDADTLPGPSIVAGGEVQWTYTVTNTGTVPLNTVKVKDDKEGTISGPSSGDDDNNGLLDPGETWIYEKTGTAISGEYTNVGTVTAKVALSGFDQTVTDKDTSNYTGGTYDFGDLPKSYRTLLGQNGPRHIVDPKLRMGSKNDYDLDGMPSPDADGDDTNGTDDEDGIDDSQLTLIEGTIPKIEVQVRNTTGKNAWLTGWIDYDGDGAWDGQATAMVLPGATSVELSLPRVPTQDIDFSSCIEPNKKRLYVLDGATRLIKYKLSNGTAEVYADGFIGAHGMAADEDGNIYVADYGAATLYVVPAGGGEKKPLTRWTRGGPPTPWALAYHNYYLYLCDRVMNRVLEIDPLTGDSAVFIGDVVDPVAITFDAAGYAYIATHNGGFLAKYDPSGNLVNPQFVNPNVGYVDISDVLINPLELPEPIETYARFRISTDKTAVQAPTGEAPDGEVEDYLVTLKPNNSILFFTGNDANTVYGCNAEGECVALADFYDNGLHNPFGLAMNCDGNLFISNSGGASITVLDTLTGLSILWDDYTDGTLQEAAGPYKILILDK